MTLEQFIQGFLGASTIEMVASVAGFICVFLLIRGNIWNFLFGFVQVTLFAWIFYHNKLYSDALLHCVYIFLQIYGWWNWSKHKAADENVLVVPTSLLQLIFWIAVALGSAGVLGFVMDTYTDASFAYPDAFTTCASLVAQWLMVRRHLVHWVFWIVVDIVAIVVYLQKGLYPTTALYFTFLIMSCIGLYTWIGKFKQQANQIRGHF